LGLVPPEPLPPEPIVPPEPLEPPIVVPPLQPQMAILRIPAIDILFEGCTAFIDGLLRIGGY
jgi:hypothetical protein